MQVLARVYTNIEIPCNVVFVLYSLPVVHENAPDMPQLCRNCCHDFVYTHAWLEPQQINNALVHVFRRRNKIGLLQIALLL